MRPTTNKRLLAAALMTLFLSFFAARGFFYHTHFVGTALVSHSHPYSDSSHHHTTTQIISIEYIAATSATDDCTDDCEVTPFFGVSILESAPEPSTAACGFSCDTCWRAPPFC